MKLRPYQDEAVNSVMAELQENQSTLLVAATGCGKTQIFCSVIKKFLPKRTLVLAHRKELIFQCVERLKSFGIEAEIEMGLHRASVNCWTQAPVVVSTVQTQISGNCGKGRMEIFDPNQFGLIVVDEAHRGVAESFRRTVSHYKKNPEIKILGVTATPDRADEEALGQVFDTVAFEYDIAAAISDGWLVPIKQQMVTIEGLDFSKCRTTAGDLNGADLARVMEAEKTMQGVADASLKIIGNKKALAFCATVKQAEMLAEIFNRHDADSSAIIHGGTPDEERKQILKMFAEGRIKRLANCAVLTEGYDEVSIEVIIMARPTKSRALYCQCIGRGTRPLGGVVDGTENSTDRKNAILFSQKPEVLVVDFAGNAGRHKLITTADILGGNYSDDVIERAVTEATKRGGPVDMAELLAEEEEDEKRRREELQRKIEEQRARDVARKAHLVAAARYSVQTINPFDIFQLSHRPSRGWDHGKVLSEKQRSLLLKQGINPDGMAYQDAKQVINEMFRRWNSKLCTLKQASLLQRYGWTADETKNMTMTQAGQEIDVIAKNGWKRY